MECNRGMLVSSSGWRLFSTLSDRALYGCRCPLGRNFNYPASLAGGVVKYRSGGAINRVVGGIVGDVSPRDGVVTPLSCVGDLVF